MRHRFLFYGMLLVGGCTAVVLPFGLTVNFAGSSRDPLPEAALTQRVQVPEGFSISTYAVGIENARMMRFTHAGDLLVSSPRSGKVFLLERDRDRDGRPDGIRVLLEGLNQPHGLTLSNENLYVAETDTVFSVPFDQETGATTGAIDRILRGIPGGGQHWTRSIGIGPDGYLYLAIGSDCNVCVEDDPRRAAINRYDLDGTNGRVYATGLRNAVGFAWQPQTHAMYATDNGRDFLGDDFPPCELDRIVDGGFYGWPYANGDKIPDPDYGDDEDKVAVSLPPAYSFDAHTAPLGISFYAGRSFPPRYVGAAFVALHGSWNRSSKSGYKVVALFFGADGEITQEDFATGFEKDNDVIGRPVDTAVGPDGALYVSDDFTGSIYRIAYGAPIVGGTAAPVALADQPVPSSLGVGEMDARLRAVALSRGRALWGANGCAACHEEGGGENYRPLVALRQRYDVASLMTYLKTPQPPMPVFPLDEFGRRDVSIFLLDRYP